MWWKVSLSILFVIICIALIIVFGPAGLKIAANVVSKEVPGKLTYKKVSGRLFGPYTVRDLDYRYADNHIHIKYLHLSWSQLNLSKPNVVIDKLNAKGVYVTLGSASMAAGEHLQDFMQQQLKKALQPAKKSSQHDSTAANSNRTTPAKTTDTTTTKKPHPWKVTIKHAQFSDIHIGRQSNQFPIDVPSAKLSLHVSNKKTQGDLSIQSLLPSKTIIQAKLSGTPDNYTLQASAKDHTKLWTMHGQGNRQQFATDHFSGILLGGSFKGGARITWAQPQTPATWQINLSTHNLDLNQLIPTLLPNHFDSDLTLTKDPNIYHINLKNLNARWRDGNFLQGKLRLDYQAKNFSNILAHFTSKRSRLDIHGDYTNQAKLYWQANLYRLDLWLPHTRGSLATQGSVIGPRKRPLVDGTLHATDLRNRGRTIQSVTASWHIDTSDQSTSSLQMALNKLATGHFIINNATLAINGTQASNNLIITATTPETNWKWFMQGAFKQGLWRGDITALQLISKPYGSWRLQKPVAVIAGQKNLDIQSMCWLSDHGQLCSQVSIDPDGSWEGGIQAQAVNLGIFNNFINKSTHINSFGNLSLNIAGHKKQLQQWHLHFNTTQGSLTYTNQVDKTANLNFTQGEFKSDLIKNNLVSQLNLSLLKSGELHAGLTLPDYTTAEIPHGKQPIRGYADITSKDLSALVVFIPPALNTNGTLISHFKLSGTIADPKLHGSASLQQGSMQLPKLGLELKNIQAKFHASGQKVHYQISLQSASRPLYLNGTAWLENNLLHARADLTGNSVLVWNTPAYTVYATPKLKVNINHRDLRLSGQLYIPQALIQPPSFYKVTTLPDHTVMIEEGQIKRNQAYYHVTMDIDVTTGNKIMFKAIGINGMLNGHLRIFHQTNQVTTAKGSINLKHAVYNLRNKQFSVTRGKLQFSNTPLTNPNLNLQAIRKINTYSNNTLTAGINTLTVGFNVTGNLHKPSITLFSKPIALSQANILSYMLFGYPSTRTSSGDLSAVASSISSLALNPKSDSGPSIKQRLNQGFHIDQFGFSRDETVDPVLGNTLSRTDSALGVGGYLSPRIYLRYQKSSGFSENMVKLRYNLTPKWILQTNTSSLGTGADLLYSFQRK